MFLQAVQDLSVGGRFGGAQYQYTLQADNLNDLTHWAPILMQKMKSLPELRDINTDQQMKGLETSLVIDRDTAARMGVNVQDIDNTLGDAFGQRQVSNIYKGLNQYHVVMEVVAGIAAGPGSSEIDLRALQLRQINSAQRLRALRTFQHRAVRKSPGSFSRYHVVFQSRARRFLGPAVEHIQAAQRQLGVPATVHATFQGTAQAFQDSLSSEPVLILTALAAVYIVLGILMKVTSIPSPFFPPFPPRASARCWPFASSNPI